ncbi:MAG: SPFH domain-containing protein [Candidatus Fermentibacteria bacterium]|nr:SPFH domain-containing protein [Candidatus Fermentibacteria bacterium]
MAKRNPVQNFMRGLIRLVILVPLWLILVYPFFSRFRHGVDGSVVWAVVYTIAIFWVANLLAKMIHVLPQWQRMVLLRLGKSVGVRGPGFFLIPPFIYSIARIVDIRITTYEVKATKTLTKDNIPIDVTAAVEMEVENPEKAAIDVQNYWKTTEWVSMEALKSTIGANDLRPLLSDTDRIADELKAIIDRAASDYGVNVRAVRITDVGTPQSLVEELAVIARAERSAKAKVIQAKAELTVAESLSEASRMLSDQPNAMELRQIQALLDISKEEGSMVIVYPAKMGMGQDIAAATAGNQVNMHMRSKSE